MSSILNMQMAASTMLPSLGLLNQMANKAEQTKPSRRNVKKVSWASENNLCQVRLFLAEDAPLQAGQIGVQDQLQAKKPWLWHAIESGLDHDLPPGFGRNFPTQYMAEEPSMVPQTTWRVPPRFVINPTWKVAAGDESEDIKTQCEREVRFLEAVYPRPSAIPPSPAEPSEFQGKYDDFKTPRIPLIPIEEEEAGDHDDSVMSFISNESLQSSGNNESSGAPPFVDNNTLGPLLNSAAMESYLDNSNTARVEPKHIPTSSSNPTIEADVAAAAAAAFLAIMRSKEEGSMIDPDLLIKILSNPQIIQTLIAQHSKNNNTQVEGIPTSLMNMNVNGNESTLKFQHELNPPNICKPQGTPTVNPATNKSRVFMTEFPSSHIQASLNPPISEAKVFVPSEMGPRPSEGLEFSNASHKPMDSSASISSTNGHASSQFMPRPATNPITSTAHAVCQTPKGVPSTAQVITGGWTSSQNEQYYKNLIQQHGGPNKNDHINQGGLQYRKELIQQHGGQQGLERGAQLQSGNMGGHCGADMNKSKFRKPCLYFRSPKGCRRGASCTFLHELADRPKLDDSDIQHPKRAKIEIEASGRH